MGRKHPYLRSEVVIWQAKRERGSRIRRTAAQQDVEKNDPTAGVPLVSDEGVEEARDWVNEHEL